jgi:hypothetical protein
MGGKSPVLCFENEVIAIPRHPTPHGFVAFAIITIIIIIVAVSASPQILRCKLPARAKAKELQGIRRKGVPPSKQYCGNT